MKNIFFYTCLISCCTLQMEDTFNSRELISSKGERIYINSINWGVTDDHQLTLISKDKEKIRNRRDTNSAVKGLEPFIYTFKNDTLTLFFNKKITYNVDEHFNTIVIIYSALSPEYYSEIRKLAIENSKYYIVPMRR